MMQNSLRDDADLMGSWDGPMGPLLKARTGLGTAPSDRCGIFPVLSITVLPSLPAPLSPAAAREPAWDPGV